MSRNSKLYDRLQRTEREFLSRVHAEFMVELSGTPSPFLHRYRSPPADTTPIDQLDRLMREIESLRRKLGEPLPGPALSALNHFCRTWDELGTRQRPEIWKSLVRQSLSEIDERRQEYKA
jgi:hypothetical protein